MNIDAIEIHSGKPDFEYQAVRRLEAKAEAKTAFSRPPTNVEVDQQLRQLAAKVGADAVIVVEYNRGISMSSWQSLKATGLAVRKVVDTRQCPVCAETIKKAAIKCRYCGADLASRTEAPPGVAATASADPRPRNVQRPAPKPHRVPDEPLRSTNNPQTAFLIIAGLAIVLFIFVVLSGS